MTKGPITSQIILFTIPLIIGSVFQQLYSLVDGVIVGNFIGSDAFAAIGTTGPIIFLIIGFGIGLGAGFNVLVAQSFGAKNYQKLKKSFLMGIILNIIVSLLLSLISLYFTPSILEMMKVPEEIIKMSNAYLSVIFAGIIFSNFYNLASGTLRALGDSKTPLFTLIFASIVNIVLDLVLIAYFKMGVDGAAIATIFSQGVSALISYYIIFSKFDFLRPKLKDFSLDKEIILSELKIGIPMALQFSITAIGVIVMQSTVNNFGTDIIASFTASNKIENIALASFVAIGTTMATFVGQNYGAGEIKRVKAGIKTAFIIQMVLSVIGILVVTLMGETLVNLFIKNPSEQVVFYTVRYLKITSLFYPFLCLIFIFRNSLQAMGDTLFPMMGGIIELGARVVFSLLLPFYIGYDGIIIAAFSAWILAGIWLLLRALFFINKKLKSQTAE